MSTRKQKPTPATHDKITAAVGQLVEAGPAIDRLANQVLPIKMAYWLSKLARLVSDEIKAYHEQRNKIITTHGKERDTSAAEKSNGAGDKIVSIERSSDQWPIFVQQDKELREIPVTIDVAPIDLTALLEMDLKITAVDLLALAPVSRAKE